METNLLTRIDKINTILSVIINEITYEQSISVGHKIINKFFKAELDFKTSVILEECSESNGLAGSVTFENEDGVVKVIKFSVKNNKQLKNTEYKN